MLDDEVADRFDVIEVDDGNAGARQAAITGDGHDVRVFGV